MLTAITPDRKTREDSIEDSEGSNILNVESSESSAPLESSEDVL